MSKPAGNPYHMVPASRVVKQSTSTPEDVRDGALPPAQSTDAGQFTVCDPPLVRNKVKEHDFPVADGLVNVKVCAPVDTVAETTLPAVMSIASVPPPRSPSALSVSA